MTPEVERLIAAVVLRAERGDERGFLRALDALEARLLELPGAEATQASAAVVARLPARFCRAVLDDYRRSADPSPEYCAALEGTGRA